MDNKTWRISQQGLACILGLIIPLNSEVFESKQLKTSVFII